MFSMQRDKNDSTARLFGGQKVHCNWPLCNWAGPTLMPIVNVAVAITMVIRVCCLQRPVKNRICRSQVTIDFCTGWAQHKKCK